MRKIHQPGCACCEPCAAIASAAAALDFSFELTGVVADLCNGSECSDANTTYLATYDQTTGTYVVSWLTTWNTCYFDTGDEETVYCELVCSDVVKRIGVTFYDPSVFASVQFRLNTDLTGLNEFVSGTPKVIPYSSKSAADWCDWTSGSITAELV